MSEKVLIIDDTVETRNRLSALLVEQVAADVVCCPADRSIALHQFAALGPTCVVIDVPVHGPGGFKLVNTLRSLDPKCLLIILSNHATEEFRERANAEGADHFLEKSTQFECVVELVRALEENR